MEVCVFTNCLLSFYSFHSCSFSLHLRMTAFHIYIYFFFFFFFFFALTIRFWRGAVVAWLERLGYGAESHRKVSLSDDWKTLPVNPALNEYLFRIAAKGEGWAPPFISCAQVTTIRLWETFTFFYKIHSIKVLLSKPSKF